jgi:hypothetical protein
MSNTRKTVDTTVSMLAAAFAIAVTVSGCALNGNDVNSLSSSQLTKVQSTCQSVVGISPGDAAFPSCTQRLAEELIVPASVSNQQYVANTILGSDASGTAAGNYFAASWGVEHHRREQACAAIGLDAGTQSFGQCVAGLDSALLNSRSEN